MKSHRLYKRKRAQRVELMIQRELATAERILDENAEAMGVLTKALDNEPRALKQAFAQIEKLTTAEAGEEAGQ
jgi:metal-responsive CopG/Arc/MetJ family transcriptional regulator